MIACPRPSEGITPPPVDYFREKREDVLISRGTVPEIQGVALGNLPKVNMGRIDNHGFEFEATYNKRIDKDWSFSSIIPSSFKSTYKKSPMRGVPPGTSQKPNDFFIMDRSFLRLKNIELGYTLPKGLLKKVGINSTRIYVNGNNLLTWKAMKTDVIDPEQGSDLNYPITKMVNFGINVTF